MGGWVAKGLSAALSLVAFASPALADPSTLPSPTYTPGSPFTGTILVTASVGGACGFLNTAPSDNYTFNDIDTTQWEATKEFRLDCNVASRVAVTSSNGGLQGPALAATPGYTNLAPYTVDLNLVGSSASIAAQCSAASLKDGSCTDFYGTAAIGQTDGLRLASPSVNVPGSFIKVSAPAFNATPSNPTLVNGTYNDTLVISVAAAP